IFSPTQAALYMLGMTSGGALADGQWWTLVTAIYLHGNLLHILFNVLWIRQLGPAVEDLYGSVRFFVIFTIAGVAGFVVSDMVTGLVLSFEDRRAESVADRVLATLGIVITVAGFGLALWTTFTTR